MDEGGEPQTCESSIGSAAGATISRFQLPEKRAAVLPIWCGFRCFRLASICLCEPVTRFVRKTLLRCTASVREPATLNRRHLPNSASRSGQHQDQIMRSPANASRVRSGSEPAVASRSLGSRGRTPRLPPGRPIHAPRPQGLRSVRLALSA